MAVLTRRGTRSSSVAAAPPPAQGGGIRINQDRAVIVSPFLIATTSAVAAFAAPAKKENEKFPNAKETQADGDEQFKFEPKGGGNVVDAPEDPYNYRDPRRVRGTNGVAEEGGAALSAKVEAEAAARAAVPAVSEGGNQDSGDGGGRSNNLFMGLFDGHSPGGESVAEQAALRLPSLLYSSLSGEGQSSMTPGPLSKDAVQRALTRSFALLDASFSQLRFGGSTGTVLLRLNSTVHFANVGDSMSMLCSYTPSTGSVKVLYKTRPDKPDLPDERKRIEERGGTVYVPPSPPFPGQRKGTARVAATVGNRTVHGLALSRSFGDTFWKERGVVSEPVIKSVGLDGAMNFLRTKWSEKKKTMKKKAAADEKESAAGLVDDDDVDDGGFPETHLFAVQCSDGVLDVIEAVQVAAQAARVLYEPEAFGQRPLGGLESLLRKAGELWEGRRPRPPPGTGLRYYRDDMTVSIAKLPI
uniref:PPM-type phosphatase domain-containing protein n=1 Tax=Odontella aurita TaxID=265563 RepID=A0A7S4NHK8_9STRA